LSEVNVKQLSVALVFLLVLAATFVFPSNASGQTNCAVVSVGAPSAVTETLAQLIGAVLHCGPLSAVTVGFEWGNSPGVYPNIGPLALVITPQNLSHTIPVTSCTTYYYRLHYMVTGYCDRYTEPVSFTTPGCSTGLGASSGSSIVGSTVYGGSGGAPAVSTPVAQPFLLRVSKASVSATKVAVDESVTVNATVSNTGTVNGNSKVTVYVNGKEAASQGITLASGEIRSLSFTVSGKEPGIYNVVVNNVPAGSFTVDYFTNNDTMIYGLILFVTVAIAGLLYLLARRRQV
jgi:hypothetical protein